MTGVARQRLRECAGALGDQLADWAGRCGGQGEGHPRRGQRHEEASHRIGEDGSVHSHCHTGNFPRLEAWRKSPRAGSEMRQAKSETCFAFVTEAQLAFEPVGAPVDHSGEGHHCVALPAAKATTTVAKATIASRFVLLVYRFSGARPVVQAFKDNGAPLGEWGNRPGNTCQ